MLILGRRSAFIHTSMASAIRWRAVLAARIDGRDVHSLASRAARPHFGRTPTHRTRRAKESLHGNVPQKGGAHCHREADPSD